MCFQPSDDRSAQFTATCHIQLSFRPSNDPSAAIEFSIQEHNSWGTWLGNMMRTDGLVMDHAPCKWNRRCRRLPHQPHAVTGKRNHCALDNFVLKCCTCCYLRRCIVYKYFQLAAFGASRQLQRLQEQINHVPTLQKLIFMPTHGDRNFPPLNATHPALFHPYPMLYSRSWIYARANLPRLSHTYNKSNKLKIVRFLSLRSHFTRCVLETGYAVTLQAGGVCALAYGCCLAVAVFAPRRVASVTLQTSNNYLCPNLLPWQTNPLLTNTSLEG